jgi:hypothetical protein
MFVGFVDGPIGGLPCGAPGPRAPDDRSSPIATFHDKRKHDMTKTTSTTRRYCSPLVRLAAGSLLASGLLIGGVTGVASAETPQSGSTGAQLAVAATPASSAFTSTEKSVSCAHAYQRGFEEGYMMGYLDGRRAVPYLSPYLLESKALEKLKPNTCNRDFHKGFKDGYAKAYIQHR